jgi:pimeloyl-ACP methyl ester carboxylesterase
MAMPLLLAAVALAPAEPVPLVVFSEFLTISDVVRPGRNPMPIDPINEAMVRGTFQPPKAGESIHFDGRTGKWQPVQPNAEGVVPAQRFRSGYLYTSYESPREQRALLRAQGFGVAYVNAVPRAGDIYGYGNMDLPVTLRKGRNDFLFTSARASFKARLDPAPDQPYFNLRDLTRPDLLPTDKSPLLAAIVVVNPTDATHEKLTCRAISPDGESRSTLLPRVGDQTFRKIGVELPAPKTFPQGETITYRLELISGRRILDRGELTLRLRRPLQVHMRTFRSEIDGSVQYYSVNPAQKPGPTNHLVFSVHGASVEALNQTNAYRSKDDVTIIAPTNRRPFGFSWEDTGRMDFEEVFRIGLATTPHDAASVHLTGHSMGGHGTWHLGTLFPDKFASISPAAGWVSVWTYPGGFEPRPGNEPERLIRQAMNPSDTISRVTNTLPLGVFVLHGDADETVPVQQARIMKVELEAIEHPDFGYYEKPGGSHWWGDDSVDWPAIFDLVRRRRIEPSPKSFSFITPNPQVSSRAWWATVVQQINSLELSRIVFASEGGTIRGTTRNVKALALDLSKAPGNPTQVDLDGQVLPIPERRRGGKLDLAWRDGRWLVTGAPNPAEKHPERAGPFREAFERRFLLVYGTKGTPEENAWAKAKARYDAENFGYIGNGSIDVVPDTQMPNLRGRNVILYGNADTHGAWKSLLGRAPVQVTRGKATVGTTVRTGSNLGVLIVFPKPGSSVNLVAAISGTGLQGFRRTDRLPMWSVGSAYPDWLVLDDDGALGAGFLGFDWTLESGQQAWR